MLTTDMQHLHFLRLGEVVLTLSADTRLRNGYLQNLCIGFLFAASISQSNSSLKY